MRQRNVAPVTQNHGAGHAEHGRRRGSTERTTEETIRERRGSPGGRAAAEARRRYSRMMNGVLPTGVLNR